MSRVSTLRVGLALMLCSMIGVACQAQPQTYRPLTEPELQVYLAAHALTPVLVEQWKDTTLILFDNGQSMGYASAAMDGNGEPAGNIMTLSGTAEKQPGTDLSPMPPPGRIATVLVGSTKGDWVMAILIYDEKMAAGTSTVMIVFQNGQQASLSTHGRRGVFVHDPAVATGWQTVRFYTAAGEVAGELTH